MKLSELADVSKDSIRDYFEWELKFFKKAKWWHEQERDQRGSSYLLRHFQDFIIFRRKVIDDCDIGNSLSELIGYPITGNREVLMSKINSPQLSFLHIYEKIVRDFMPSENV